MLARNIKFVSYYNDSLPQKSIQCHVQAKEIHGMHRCTCREIVLPLCEQYTSIRLSLSRYIHAIPLAETFPPSSIHECAHL